MSMDFALFYEIPVPQPWGPDSDHIADKNTVAQAVHGEKSGFTSFWTVEHHFLDEYSHCSAPDALYGAIAAQTTTLRIGHGVRLLPYPYNHPVRAAEAAAIVDLCVRRPPRVRHRTLLHARRTRRVRCRSQPDARPMGGRPPPRGRRVDNDTFEANGPTWTVPPRRHLHHGALRRDRRAGLRRSRRILRVVCAHRALEVARRYDAADCDILLCLLNPYKMSHESVMHSIELLGEHVIPALRG